MMASSTASTRPKIASVTVHRTSVVIPFNDETSSENTFVSTPGA